MKNVLNRHRGHTLLELIIAMFVVSILAYASIPLFNSYSEETKIDELKATILKAVTAQERFFAATGSYATSAILLTNYDFPEIPNSKMKIFTGARVEAGVGMTFWVNGSYDIGRPERECWVYAGFEGSLQRLKPSDPIPFAGVDCN